MKFREHIGGFTESMKTTVEIADLNELKQLLQVKYEHEIERIIFKDMGVDDRNGWNTFMVCVDFVGLTPAYPVGWSDGSFN